MQCFIGLTFSEQYLHYKKIDNFRRRFDQKYTKSNILQMTLLPPFEIASYDDDFIEALVDELEGHLTGHTEVGDIHFDGVDFNSNKKRNVFLRPELPLELQYCQQSLWEVITEAEGSFRQRKRPVISQEETTLRTFLPIGRTNSFDQFEAAVETAKEEFEDPFSLRANSICLFESTPGQWLVRKELYHLGSNNAFEFNEIDCLKGQVQALYV